MVEEIGLRTMRSRRTPPTELRPIHTQSYMTWAVLPGHGIVWAQEPSMAILLLPPGLMISYHEGMMGRQKGALPVLWWPPLYLAPDTQCVGESLLRERGYRPVPTRPPTYYGSRAGCLAPHATPSHTVFRLPPSSLSTGSCSPQDTHTDGSIPPDAPPGGSVPPGPLL